MARTDNTNKRRLELIHYPEGEDLVDHKGRSKPLYKPSSPRPSEWRPERIARLLLGLFPGLRLMVTKSVPAGLPYALLGLLTGLGALLVVLNWSVAAETIRQLHIRPQWILIRAGAVLLLVAVYELLRMGAALEEKPRGPRIPRVLAMAALPAFVVVLGAPSFMDLAPRLLESAWFGALVLAFGALPACAACMLDNMTGREVTTFRLRAGIVLVLLVLGVTVWSALGYPIFEGLQGAARASGFRVLPSLIP